MDAGIIRKKILTRWAPTGLAAVAVAVLTANAAPFEEVAPPFPPLYSGSLAWGDYDNDGDLDLAVLGTRYPITPTTRLYRNDGGGTFLEIGTAFEQLSNGGLAWGDYDNDGDLDLATCGIYSGLDSHSLIYRNLGNGQFMAIASLIGCKNGTVVWGDFDNDGDLDLLMNGENSGARLYRNDRGSISLVATALSGLDFGFATAADFDNDGRLDPLLSGFGGGYTAQAYMNLGALNFTPIPPFIGGGGNGAAWSDFDNDGDFDLLLTGGPFQPTATRLYRKEIDPTNFTAIVLGVGGLHGGLAAWGDYDNDGRPDFVVAGRATNNTVISRVYHNDGAGAFSDSTLTIPGVSSGSAAWADYDNDGRLDLALFGHPLDTNVYARMYHNTNVTPNSPPGAPSFPQVTVSSSGATFSWAAAVDANQTGGLTYNLRVGTAPGGADVLAPMADLATGFRRVAQHGNTGLRQSWTLTNLAAGNYYWSVQAVDHAFAGGPFTPEQSFFAVTPVFISDIPDQAISISSATPALPFVVRDPEFGAAALGLRGDSSNPNLVPVGNIVFGGSGSNRTVRVTPVAGLSGTTTITVTATNANGRYASDSFLLIVQNLLPKISAIADQITAAGAPTALLPFTIGDPETPAANLLVTARSSNTNFVPEHLITFSGSGSNRTVQATPFGGRSGSTLIIVTVTDADGGSASEAFQFSSGIGFTRFTEVPSGMPSLYPVMAAAGDYDNDGDLDVLMAGTITNDIHTTRLYRNNGDGAFADSGVTLPAVTAGALGWADADGDADLDFVLTGYVGPSTNMYASYYANLGDGSFVPYRGPPAVQQASLDWADFDGDGDLDLILAGTGLPSTYTRVYRNHGNFGFSDAMAGISYTYDGALAFGDYDGDGFPDALVTGLATSIPPVTYLYRNTGSGSFTFTPHSIPGIFRSAVAWGDYDNDGDLDVAMAGLGTPPEQFARIYRNNGAGAFGDINAPLIRVNGASVAWGDYDNDGDLDLVVAGYVQSGGGVTTPTTGLYRNDNGVFLDSGLPLPGVAGHADWGDYDNDGDLDLLLMGNTVPGPRPLAKTILLRNDFSVSNVTPAPPENLTAVVSGNSVTLSWAPGSDINQPAGLTYNVRVGTAPGQDDVVSAMARADGRRLLAKWGNATPRLTRTIRDLPFGHLYWSVQTVDHAFAGSPFAPEQSFHINLPPVLTDLAELTVPVNVSPIVQTFNISDDATPASNLVVTASLLFTDFLMPEHLELAGDGAERTLRITPPPNLVGNTAIIITVRDDEGGVTTDSFVLRIRNEGPFLPLFTNQIVSVTAAPLAIPFEVYDPEFGTNITLTVISQNTNLVAPEGLSLSGSGSNRVLHVTWRPDQTGTASIVLEAIDPLGARVLRAFVLTVVNYPPTISPIADVNLYPGLPVPLIPFTANDPETPPEQLYFRINISNPAFLPTNVVTIEGTGTNRVLRIIPPADAVGSTTIQIIVSESTNGALTSFVLRIEAFTSVGITLPRYTNGLLALIDFDRDNDLDAFTAGNSAGTRRTLLLRNTGDYIFTSALSTFFFVDQLAAAWGDIDRDGDADLVYSGNGGTGGPALRLYRNDGGGAMTQLSNSFLATARGSLDWGDFDNDGDLDLLLTGAMATTNTTRIYRNNGAEGFSAMFSSLPPAVGAGSSWGDYDRDGDPDILLVNSNSTRIFRNNGNDTFTDSSVALPGINGGMAAWGDFDNDGDLDVALAGAGIGASNYLSRIYRNDTTTFTGLDAGLPGLAQSTVLWADLNNDGWLDLLLTGHELNNTIRTLLCENRGDGTFGIRSNYLPAVSRGAVAAGDLDADGDLDLLLSGAPLTSSPVLRNNAPATNLPPSVPANLLAVVTSNSVLLGWSPASDDHQTSGLTYNVRIGTTPDDGDILPAMANPANGFRYVVKPGNAGTRLDKRLFRIPPGAYYWTVQAIDHAFLASPFAAEGTFVVTNKPPVISAIGEYIGPRNRTVGPVLFTIGDLETPAANLVLRGTSSDTNLVRDTNIVFDGAGSNRLAYITPVGTATGQVSITLTVEDAHGASAQSTFALIVLQAAPDLSDIPNQLTAFNTPTPPIPFLVSDLDHDAGELIVTADVSNTNLVPLANIQFGGSGSNRTVTLTPALNQHGMTTVFITVTDPLGEITSKAFALTVTNHAPVVSTIADQAVLPGVGPLVVPFTIGDAETPAGALELSFSSSNTNLLPLVNIVLGGSESNRTITLTAVSNALGAATVTVTVHDAGATTASDAFVFRIEQFTPLVSTLTNLWQSQAAWGDYDNDGDLDLLMSGWTSSAFLDTFLYRNEGSNGWTRVTNGVPTGNRGGVAWGDFNNDSWLDILYVSTSSAALYRNTGTNSFIAYAIGVPGMFQAVIAPGDFDNDGRLDFAVAGDIGGAAPNGTTRIFRNTGNGVFGVFTEISANLPAVNDASLAWADYDRDGDLDLLIAGSLFRQGGAVSHVFRNDAGVFTDANAGLFGAGRGSAVWGDYNHDGYPDILLCGLNGNSNATRLYRNNSGSSFVEVATTLPLTQAGSGAWGDFDNDGLLDMLLTGLSQSGPFARVFQGDGNGGFTDIITALPGVYWSTGKWADIDGDGDLDVLTLGTTNGGTSGAITRLFRNNSLRPNLPPDPPTNIAASLDLTVNRAVFSWSGAMDTETPAAGLTHALRIGTNSGGGQIVAVPADSATGGRRLVQFGENGSRGQWTIEDMPKGEYFWAVQTVDNAFAGSAFSPEQTFAITNARPVISDITNRIAFPGVRTVPIPFFIADEETPAPALTLMGFSSDPALIPPASIQFGGAGGTRTVSFAPSAQLGGLATITVRVTDTAGASRSDSFAVIVEAFSTVTNVATAGGSMMTWGDFDNDNDLDLFASGGAPSPGFGQFVPGRLYRNSGGTNFAVVPENNFTAATDGAATFGDADGDGDLDLLLAGTLTSSFVALYRNNHPQPFSQFVPGSLIQAPAGPAGAWGDADNDGDLDFLMAGRLFGASQWPTILYRNNGSGVFSNAQVSLPGVSGGTVLWADFDNDGDQDIFLSGNTNAFTNAPIARLYRNNGGTNFTDIAAALPGVVSSAAAWADFDRDGNLDLALCGLLASSNAITRVFRNEDGTTFVDMAAGLPGVSGGSIAWADYDNDGWTDLFVCGTTNSQDSGAITRIYRNNSDGTFSDTRAGLPDVTRSSVAWADIDNDGDIDLALSGTGPKGPTNLIARVFRNNTPTPPALLEAPTALIAAVSGRGVELNWQPSPQIAPPLTDISGYNLRVVRTNHNVLVVPPHANQTNGFRRIARLGNAGSGTHSFLENLSPGDYAWSVQAVSHNYAGSEFSVGGRFTISNTPPLVTNQFRTVMEDQLLSLQLYASDPDGQLLTFTVLTPPTNGTVTGSAPFLSYRPFANYFGPDSMTFTVHDTLVTVPGVVTINVLPVADVAATRMGLEAMQAGGFEIVLRGEPYQSYAIESSTDLITWILLDEIRASPSGDIRQAVSTIDTQRFFRARSLP